MITTMKKSSMFTVFLGREAHQIADKFCQLHSDFAKAQRVYLNTLAVYAVNYYLQCLRVETDLEASDSWDAVMQTLLDVSDLVVKGKGKLACRCVMPGDDWVQLSEDMLDSLCCVAVKIDGEMKQGKVLGFTDKVTDKKVFVSELRPIYELPEYLRKCEFDGNHNSSEKKISASYIKSVETD